MMAGRGLQRKLSLPLSMSIWSFSILLFKIHKLEGVFLYA